MASQRNMYTANNSSTYLPSHQRESSSLEDYKPPAEYDIINSYTTTAVPLPKQAHPVNSSALSLPLHSQPPTPGYPPFSSKQSFYGSYAGQTDLDGGTEENSSYNLSATKEIPQAEKRGLLDTILPDSLACRLYVLVVLIETIIDIAIEVELRARVEDFVDQETSNQESNDLRKRLPVYLAIFSAAHIFQLVMAIDAVHARNTLQFMSLTAFNALFLLYAVIQIFEIRDSLPSTAASSGISDIPVNVLTTIIPIVIAVAEIAYIALGWKIWREFGWKVYKKLGADRRVKKMYAQYQIFLGIMKFDLFFFVGFCVQLIALVLVQKDWEWYLTCAALPFSLLVLVVGWVAARSENRYMMYSFIFGCAGALVYFVYKLIRLYSGEDGEDVSKTLTVFAVIAIILLLTTVVIAVMVMRNFGEGLKTKITKHQRSASLKRNGTTAEHLRNQSYPMSSNRNRMSID